MNLDLVFKAFFLLEVLIALVCLFRALDDLRVSWRSTLAGLFIIGVSLSINGLHFYRVGQAQDLIGLVQFMAVGIGFLYTADGASKKI